MKLVGWRVFNKVFSIIFQDRIDAEKWMSQFGVSSGFQMDAVYAVASSTEKLPEYFEGER